MKMQVRDGFLFDCSSRLGTSAGKCRPRPFRLKFLSSGHFLIFTVTRCFRSCPSKIFTILSTKSPTHCSGP